MSVAIVTTTINVPRLFEGYCQDFLKHGHKDVIFIVIGDQKTPREVEQYCKSLQQQYGYLFEYYDVDRQRSYLRRFPQLAAYLPYNSVQRRNIGLLRAYEMGVDVIVTVDDDNYLFELDLLRHHKLVGTTITLPSFGSSVGWFNPCQFLSADPPVAFYHRGFPMSQRRASCTVKQGVRKGRLAVNVGLWIGDPDVDAWVRMTMALNCDKWRGTGNFTLDPDTWAPFNSQQTALARDLLPTYFLNPNAGRYDDIWASYTVQRIAGHMGDLVSFGSPIVDHRQQRSWASLWRDLDDERMGALLTDEFVCALRSLHLTGTSYSECYAEFIDHLDARSRNNEEGTRGGEEFLREYVQGMRMWAHIFDMLDGSGAYAW